jgi:lipoate-protein ligase A|tara:strand:- start:680 stop:922 length:243 start_codon:yes stop_codon:yes gene_type:complete
MNQKQFIEEVFEIAYGENAINRNFTFEEVIETLREFSDNALIFEESGLTREELENISEISQESYKKGYIDRKKDELLKKC